VGSLPESALDGPPAQRPIILLPDWARRPCNAELPSLTQRQDRASGDGNSALQSRDHKLKLGTGFGGLRTLQFGTEVKVDGRMVEYLYGTTFTGALKLMVPEAHAHVKRVVTLRRTGYKGVTGLSTALCNHEETFSMIVAINKNAGTVTWTTVRGVPHASPSTTVKRGAVAPGAEWHLHAAM